MADKNKKIKDRLVNKAADKAVPKSAPKAALKNAQAPAVVDIVQSGTVWTNQELMALGVSGATLALARKELKPAKAQVNGRFQLYWTYAQVQRVMASQGFLLADTLNLSGKWVKVIIDPLAGKNPPELQLGGGK